VTGSTKSTNFPTKNPYQAEFQGGNNDAFIVRFSAAGSSLQYGTYLGGTDHEAGTGIAVDDSGCVYVAGITVSSDFPTQDPFQMDQGSHDAFVAKFCFLVVCGDADGSETVDIDDVVYLIRYIFAGGPPPFSYAAGNPDCSGAVDIDDVVWLVNYIFSGGNAPCDTDGDGQPDC
jgi:hypothetical protein